MHGFTVSRLAKYMDASKEVLMALLEELKDATSLLELSCRGMCPHLGPKHVRGLDQHYCRLCYTPILYLQDGEDCDSYGNGDSDGECGGGGVVVVVVMVDVVAMVAVVVLMFLLCACCPCDSNRSPDRSTEPKRAWTCFVNVSSAGSKLNIESCTTLVEAIECSKTLKELHLIYNESTYRCILSYHTHASGAYMFLLGPTMRERYRVRERRAS
eukprot:6185214-Pleurochrysis_carterae.AAC.1